ncbi:MAG: hypothetical protein KGM42_12810 [Hyphomicrobiales bacterium]|nr:hypothetical protein [Hyphomicrobiales bacterium]
MSNKDLRLLILGLIAALLLVGGVGLFVVAGSSGDAPPLPQRADAAPPKETPPPAPTPSLPPPPAPPNAAADTAGPPPEIVAARAAVLEKIAAAPDVARFFDHLRLALPGEYETAIGALARRKIGGGDDTPDYYLSEAVKSLRQSRGALAAKADTPALANVFAEQLAVLNALSTRDPKACVDFLYGGASESFFKFSEENRALVADLAIAGLDAIVDGKTRNIARGAPNDADFQLFEAALQKAGLSAVEIAALLDGKTPDPPLPDAQMCKAGQIYLQTLSALPDPARTRIFALAIDLMARS